MNFVKNNNNFIFIFELYYIMKNRHIFTTVFQMTLLFALILSIYIFVKTIVLKHDDYATLYNNWQLPIIFALYLDALYH